MRTFVTADSMQPVYDAITRVATEITDGDYSAIVEIGRSTCRVRSEQPSSVGTSVSGKGCLPEPLQGLIAEPMLRQATEYDRTEVIPDVHDVRDTTAAQPGTAGGPSQRSVMVVPYGDRGVLLISAQTPDAFDASTRSQLETICSLGCAAIERITDEEVTDRDDEFHRDLIRTFSHDVRTPLNVALGHVDLATQPNADPAEHLLWIEKSLHRIDELFDRLSRLVIRGDILEQQSIVNLEAVATQIWAAMHTHEATLTIEPLFIEADERGVGQLLENLFKNAIEHAGMDVAVSVGPLADRSGFYVEDDGPGFEDFDTERLFEPGYSSQIDHESGGMGLAIVKRIAEAHNWTVEITESAAGGARFEIRGVNITEPVGQ